MKRVTKNNLEIISNNLKGIAMDVGSLSDSTIRAMILTEVENIKVELK